MFKILVLEDDRELNRSVCSFLNQSGYEAVGCLSAEEAYDVMYETVFDLIISDIMMPNIDGFEFVKTVRSLNENIPILFMTARDDFASKQRGFRVGIDDYMVKPIDLDELFLRIGALLRRAKIASSRRLSVGNLVMVAFLVSCCMILFITTMADSMDIVLTSENIQKAAKLTMLNVILLTLLFTIFDFFRRKMTTGRATNIIIDAGKKLTQGDFSVRIPQIRSFGTDERFNEIAKCFNKMAEELSSIETLRTDFVANVSHELKTPLAVMQNYGTLLQQPGLSEQQRMEYAKAITDASRRLANLITNILKLNKLENQQIVPLFEEYDLSEQLCQCLLGFEEAWEKKGLNIETDINDGVRVKSDAEMMSLVWNNLFSNAIKFTEEGGCIFLSIQEDETYAIIKIKDTGCGISKVVGKRIFDKFYQGDTSHATQGNGLGLALVKRVIDIMEGDISVESELGKGTTFTVKIRKSGGK